jgi:hypothetical protein
VTTESTPTARTGIGPQLAPHAAVALLTAAAAATHAAAALTGEQATVTASVAATAVVLAVAVATRQGRRIACRKSRSRLYAFLAVAAGWLTTITATGLSGGAVAILAVMVSAISLHWWRAKRIANPGPEAVAAPVDADHFADLWKQRLGAGGCVLEGSRLTRPEPIAAGVRYVLELVGGKQTYGGVLGALEQIRGGLYLLPAHDLIVERHPQLSAAHLLLTIVTRSPITQAVDWPGPQVFDPATGCVALGPHTDGQGVASWRVYTDNSLWGGYMAGSSGSGKSRMFDSLAMAVAASTSHPTVVMFIDGDEGASSPLLTRYADHTALDEDLTDARLMLAGALLLMQLRRAENIAYGLEGFTPTAERPGVLIFIDECHVIFADETCREMAAEITRRGRKVGVNIVAASQVATMDAFGGAGKPGSDVLRSSLRAGNGVILRSLTNNTKNVFRVDLDPTQFPELPGYAYYVAAKGSTARTAPFRGYFPSNQAKDYWAPRIHWRGLDAGEGNAWAHGYTRRKETADAARDAALARIADAKAGRRPLGKDTPITRTIPAHRPLPAPAFHVAQFPVWQAPAAPARPALTDSQRAVLDAIAGGASLAGEIAKAQDVVKDRQVYNILNELKAAQLIDKQHGRYVVLAA